jgi:hypothetical protein
MTLQKQTRLMDLTVDEFEIMMRSLMEDVVQQAIFEIEQQLPDPDAGLVLRPDIEEYLRQALTQNGDLLSVEDVKRELKLDE